ncbi:MAG: hypothetical protein M3R55_03555 [Acidobacteriota bacterium]|nr:hypothetical protein [Acidobacteriota bacterium]
MLFVGTGAQGDGANRPFFAVKPGASGDITLKAGETENAFIAWNQTRASIDGNALYVRTWTKLYKIAD